MVVCDEGHIIKNSKSAISMAVSKITTQRRIVLTGTPIQNNLKECKYKNLQMSECVIGLFSFRLQHG